MENAELHQTYDLISGGGRTEHMKLMILEETDSHPKRSD
jgi:hypothetical protein